MDPTQPTQPVPTSAPATERAPDRLDGSSETGRPVKHVRVASKAPAVDHVFWLAREAQSLRWLAALAIAAAVLGKGFAPALRGYRAGIGGWIAFTDTLTALLSQLLIVCTVMMCFRLVLATLRRRELSALERLFTVPAAAGVLTLAVAASKADLTPRLTLAVGCASSLVALACGFRALHVARTRALGLVLGVVGAAALMQTAVRRIALEASDRALAELFDTARALATLAFVLFVAGLAIALAWLLTGRRSSPLVAGALLLGCGLLAWIADQGSRYGAVGVSYLLGRTLTEMSRQPSPLFAPLVRHWVVLVSLAAAMAAVLWPRRDHPVQACLGIVVLTGVDADTPALGLLLIVAALSAALASTMKETPFEAMSAPSSTEVPTGNGSSTPGD